MTAGGLARHFAVSKPTMSAHFNIFLTADLIGADKVGRIITYRLTLSVLEDALLEFTRAFGLTLRDDATSANATELGTGDTSPAEDA
jgi:DNA-binding transcriptional ArsR family regulator